LPGPGPDPARLFPAFRRSGPGPGQLKNAPGPARVAPGSAEERTRPGPGRRVLLSKQPGRARVNPVLLSC
jgi:hypothetical protein